MAGHRIERVNEQLKREIARLVVGEVKDPRIGAVTVTRVSTAPDLTFARVHVQLLGDEEDRARSMQGLRAASSFIRTALAERVPLRRVPELRFERDRSLEHAMRIEELLAEAGVGEAADAAAGDDAGAGDEARAGDDGGSSEEGGQPDGTVEGREG